MALYDATGDIDTTISGFETIEFGWTTNSDLGDLFGSDVDGGASGTQAATLPITFDAVNTSGVDTFVIALRGAGNGLTLDNLDDGVNIVFGDDTGVNVSFNTAENTLNAADGGELNLELSAVLGDGASTNINGFETVNVDVASTVGFPLDGDRVFSFDFGTETTNLVVTGGEEDGSLDIFNGLEASLKVIDFKGFTGDVEAELIDAVTDVADSAPDATNNTNTTIVVNNTGDFNFDESAVTGNTVTTYVFGADVTDENFDWTFAGFQAFNALGGSLSNLSILDLSALDVDGLSDITIDANGGNALITSNQGLDFEIVLTGVDCHRGSVQRKLSLRVSEAEGG